MVRIKMIHLEELPHLEIMIQQLVIRNQLLNIITHLIEWGEVTMAAMVEIKNVAVIEGTKEDPVDQVLEIVAKEDNQEADQEVVIVIEKVVEVTEVEDMEVIEEETKDLIKEKTEIDLLNLILALEVPDIERTLVEDGEDLAAVELL